MKKNQNKTPEQQPAVPQSSGEAPFNQAELPAAEINPNNEDEKRGTTKPFKPINSSEPKDAELDEAAIKAKRRKIRQAKRLSLDISQENKDAAKLYEWAAREVDPMPVRYVDGERYGSVLVSEFEAWFKRNTGLYSERRRNGR